MRARQVLVVGAALAVLAGCGSTAAEQPAEPAAPATTAADQLSDEAIAKAEAAAGIPPKPDQQTADAYLAALRKIDPEIVESADPDKVINRGRDQCSTLRDFPKDQAKQLMFANTRFSSPDHPDGFGDAKARKINAVVHKYICPTF